jgi:4-amino-4-deoxy-L-arabinose transferase-like glycosyltransferase
VFGINEFAARLPLLLTSIALLALIFVWVKQLAGRDTALISVTVLSSMILFFGASAFVMTDMPMALGIVLVMVGFWNAVCRDAPNRHWGVAIAVGLSIGMLAKGPVAVILCGIPIVVWLTVMRKWSVLRDLPWVTMTFVFIVLTVPWYIAAEIATPGFLHYFIIGEHFERFVVPGWDGDLYGVGHDQAKGAIWVFFLGISLPWSFALLPLLYRGRKTVRTFTQDRSGLLFYLLMWTLAPLILFTPAANLLPAYGLPGLPAAAILLTLLCAKIWSPIGAVASRTAFLAASSISFAAFASVFVAVTLYPNSPHIKSQLAVITAGYDIAPDYPVYVVGPRRYSAEFYTNGVAKTISPHELPNLQGNAILTVPLSLEEQVATLPYDHIGTFGRYDLFIKTDTVVQP